MAVALALVAPALVAAGTCDDAHATSEAAKPVALRYDARMDGVDGRLRTKLEPLLKTYVLKKDPPATLTGLERRARGDVDTAGRVLRAEGYYDALVRYRVEREGKPTVVFSIDPGPRYVLAAYDVVDPSGDAGAAPSLAAAALDHGGVGEPATADRIETLQTTIVAALLESSYALAEVVERRVVVDHKERAVRVTLTLAAGEPMTFGHMRVVGLDQVPEYYVRRRARWELGDRYQAAKLAQLRAALLATGLFSSVRVRPAVELVTGDRLPIEVDLVEAKARTVGFGVRYSSSEGIGGKGFWENRNFRRDAERVRITVLGSQQEIGGTFSYRRPDFLDIDQALLADASLATFDTDAFDATKAFVSTGLERPLTRRSVGTVAIAYEYGPVSAVTGACDPADLGDPPCAPGDSHGRDEQTFSLLSLPVSWRLDTSDRLLDPHRGNRLLVELIPYGGIDPQLTFGLGRISERVYVRVPGAESVVLAGRASVGSIVGESLFDVPADKRFYAGGGGSVRGYKFQFAGPLTSSNDPIGGRSLVEVGAELRWRVYGNFGLVPFLDGGTVYADSLPSFDSRLFWGGGLGLRYFSAAGPLRLDVATPINGRDGIDDRVQFYLSLGQAF